MFLGRTAATLAAGLFVFTAIGFVSAQEAALAIDPALGALSPDEMVAKRQALMKEDGRVLKQAGKLSGPEAAAAADTLIANLSNLTVLFPEGTGTAASEALPVVWENQDVFQAMLHKGVAAATQMKVAATAGDSAAYEVAVKTLGGVCAQCHQQFKGD